MPELNSNPRPWSQQELDQLNDLNPQFLQAVMDELTVQQDFDTDTFNVYGSHLLFTFIDTPYTSQPLSNFSGPLCAQLRLWFPDARLTDQLKLFTLNSLGLL